MTMGPGSLEFVQDPLKLTRDDETSFTRKSQNLTLTLAIMEIHF